MAKKSGRHKTLGLRAKTTTTKTRSGKTIKVEGTKKAAKKARKKAVKKAVKKPAKKPVIPPDNPMFMDTMKQLEEYKEKRKAGMKPKKKLRSLPGMKQLDRERNEDGFFKAKITPKGKRRGVRRKVWKT